MNDSITRRGVLIALTAVMGSIAGCSFFRPSPETVPEGTSTQGIENGQLVIDNHLSILANKSYHASVIKTEPDSPRTSISFTSDVNERRAYWVREKSNENIPTESYVTNNAEYTRSEGAFGDISYRRCDSCVGFERKHLYTDNHFMVVTSFIRQNTFQLESVSEMAGSTYYNFTTNKDGGDFGPTESGFIEIRKDGFITEVEVRKHGYNGGILNTTINYNITTEPNVSEPEWIATADRRADERDNDNPWECDEDDIDRDDDGLCNET